jgi:hypothetical protein
MVIYFPIFFLDRYNILWFNVEYFYINHYVLSI